MAVTRDFLSYKSSQILISISASPFPISSEWVEGMLSQPDKPNCPSIKIYKSLVNGNHNGYITWVIIQT